MALAGIEESRASLVARSCLRFLILTAARSGTARGALWSEIDPAVREWRIPGSRMKSGAAHRIPLSDAALTPTYLAPANAPGRHGLRSCRRARSRHRWSNARHYGNPFDSDHAAPAHRRAMSRPRPGPAFRRGHGGSEFSLVAMDDPVASIPRHPKPQPCRAIQSRVHGHPVRQWPCCERILRDSPETPPID